MANDELEAVKAALRNHNLCNDACTPAKHIAQNVIGMNEDIGASRSGRDMGPTRPD